METFGSFLKTHREKKSIRLEEIASITKIHLHSLELLEASQWEQLPPEPFIRGFIIAYAKYVGLEPKDVLDRYYEETGRKKGVTTPILVEKHQPQGTRPSAAAAGSETPGDVIAAVSFPAPSKIVAAGAAAVAVLVLGILISVGKKADQPAENVPVAATSPSTPAAAATDAAKPATQLAMPTAGKTGEDRNVALAAPKQAEAPKPASEFEHEIQVEGKERTWVKVVVDENPPLEFFLSENEKATYNAKKKIKVVLGNAAGARVLHNGKPVEGTKFMGTIRSFRFPAGSKFPQDLAPKKEAPAGKPESTTAAGDVVPPSE